MCTDHNPGASQVPRPNKDQTLEKSQLDKFKDKARELECDDDEQRFKERLGKLVKAKRPNEEG
jgi:hypothetical protein